MLPSALSRSESFRSVHVGRSQYSRCCHLFGALWFCSFSSGTRTRPLTQSPEFGFCLFSSWNGFDFVYVDPIRADGQTTNVVFLPGFVHSEPNSNVSRQSGPGSEVNSYGSRNGSGPVCLGGWQTGARTDGTRGKLGLLLRSVFGPAAQRFTHCSSHVAPHKRFHSGSHSVLVFWPAPGQLSEPQQLRPAGVGWVPKRASRHRSASGGTPSGPDSAFPLLQSEP